MSLTPQPAMLALLNWIQADIAVTDCNFHCSPTVALNFIDHIVGNQPDDEMVPVSDW